MLTECYWTAQNSSYKKTVYRTTFDISHVCFWSVTYSARDHLTVLYIYSKQSCLPMLLASLHKTHMYNTVHSVFLTRFVSTNLVLSALLYFSMLTFPCYSLNMHTQGKPGNEAMYMYIYVAYATQDCASFSPLSPSPPSPLSLPTV